MSSGCQFAAHVHSKVTDYSVCDITHIHIFTSLRWYSITQIQLHINLLWSWHLRGLYK